MMHRRIWNAIRLAGRRSGFVLIVGVASSTVVGCRSEVEPPPDLPVGTGLDMRAPPLRGVTIDGLPFDLDQQLGGPAVVVFYRSAGCGLCRVQLTELQQHLPAYREIGVTPVAVTLDTPETSRQLLDHSTYGFQIVSVDTATFQLWGALDEENGPALPTTYILGPGGMVKFRYLGRNASDRARDAELLTVLETLGLAR